MSPIFRTAIKPILCFLWTYLTLHVVFAFIHVPRGSNQAVGLAAVAVVVMWILLVRVTEASRAWVNAIACCTVPVSVWASFLSVTPDSLMTYGNWWPGPAAVLTAFFLIFGRHQAAVTVIVVSAVSAIVLAMIYRDPGEVLPYALPAACGPLIWSVGVAATLELIGKISDRHLGLASLQQRHDEEAALSREAVERQNRDVEVMRAESLTHLQEIAALPLGVDITEEQRRRWGMGALTLRDELASRALLDDGMREALRSARCRGAEVEMQDGHPESGDLSDSARRVLRSAVDIVGPGERLSLRRQAGRAVISVVFMGPTAKPWLESLGPLPDGVAVIREEDLVHLTYDERVFETQG